MGGGGRAGWRGVGSREERHRVVVGSDELPLQIKAPFLV